MDGIGAWFLGKGVAGLARWAWIGIIAALVFVVIMIADRWHENTITTAENAGATKAVVAGQNQTLEQLGDANDAEQNLNAGGERSSTRYNDCLRDNRKPRSCQRYNPDAGQ